MMESVASALGVIASYPHHIHAASVIAGAQRIANQHGLDVIAATYTGVDQQSELAMQLAGTLGIIVVADAAPNDFILRLHSAYGKPVVLVAHHIAGSGLPEIVFNNRRGIQLLIRHLAEGCHRRRPVLVQGLPSQRDSQEREAAFREEVHRYALNVPESHFLRGDYVPEVAVDSVRDLVASRAGFDAVVASDYVMGAAVVRALRESRLRVPEDVSVVGYGDGEEALAARLTTVTADVVELGVRAARALLSQINRIPTVGVTMLNPTLVIRDTCGFKPEPAQGK